MLLYVELLQGWMKKLQSYQYTHTHPMCRSTPCAEHKDAHLMNMVIS